MFPLFVPGDRPDRFAKASNAAAIAILDLEDAVAPDRKADARSAVAAAVRAGSRAWVRVNPLGTPAWDADAVALAGCAPAGVMIAKASSPEDVAAVRARFPGTLIVALIETLAGMASVDAIAASGAGVLAFGAYDFCAELGARPTPEVLIPWRARVVFAARRAEIEALDTPFASIADTEGLAADARRAADAGFSGKLAIHPNQIATLRSAFAPTDDEVRRARDVVARFSTGVAVVDGTMIDAPLLALARRTLARADSKEA
jgi:citrate lyase subunit beta/citryl-CoA lyase